MRVIGYIDHRAYKISVFSWSEKYIVKIEAGYFEQSYKFRQEDFPDWQELKILFDDSFFDAIHKRFLEMSKDAKAAGERYDTRPGLA